MAVLGGVGGAAYGAGGVELDDELACAAGQLSGPDPGQVRGVGAQEFVDAGAVDEVDAGGLADQEQGAELVEGAVAQPGQGVGHLGAQDLAHPEQDLSAVG